VTAKRVPLEVRLVDEAVAEISGNRVERERDERKRKTEIGCNVKPQIRV
jgi:hypothetical protein